MREFILTFLIGSGGIFALIVWVLALFILFQWLWERWGVIVSALWLSIWGGLTVALIFALLQVAG